MTRRNIIGIAAVCGCIAIGFWAAWAIVAAGIQNKAEQLISDLRPIRAGDTNAERLYNIASRYSNELPSRQACLNQTCTISLRLSNEPLARAYVFPSTSLIVNGVVRQGRTIHLQIEFVSFRKRFWYIGSRLGDEQPHFLGVSVVQDSADSPYYAVGRGFQIARTSDGPSGDSTLVVHLTPDIDSVTRDNALALNVGCLTRLFGCTSTSQVLPRLRDGFTRNLSMGMLLRAVMSVHETVNERA